MFESKGKVALVSPVHSQELVGFFPWSNSTPREPFAIRSDKALLVWSILENMDLQADFF